MTHDAEARLLEYNSFPPSCRLQNRLRIPSTNNESLTTLQIEARVGKPRCRLAEVNGRTDRYRDIGEPGLNTIKWNGSYRIM